MIDEKPLPLFGDDTRDIRQRVDFDLEEPARSPMSRHTDPDTSKQTAAAVEPSLGKIQVLVLGAFLEHGPMSARTAERLECFEDYGFSTIRKRISELAQAGRLETVGVEREGRCPATVYALREGADHA